MGALVGRGSAACPFGICFRPTDEGAGEAPFPAWEYRPSYLPDPLAIHIGSNSDVVAEPLVFYLPFARRPNRDDPDPARRQPRQHPAGPRVITSVSIVRSSAAEPSAVLRAVAIACPWLKIEAGGENLMELGFDDGRTGKTADFRQVLPLVIRR